MTNQAIYLRAVPDRPIVHPCTMRMLAAAIAAESEGQTAITSADPALYAGAPFYLFPVVEVEPPEVDPRLERIEAADPVFESGEWRQSWTVRDATQDEIEVWDRFNTPQPNYDILYLGLLTSGVYQNYVSRALVSTNGLMPVAMAVLIDALREARTKQPIVPAIRSALSLVLQAGDFEPPELAELQGLLVASNLAETYSLS